jgi:hypothetical protein
MGAYPNYTKSLAAYRESAFVYQQSIRLYMRRIEVNIPPAERRWDSSLIWEEGYQLSVSVEDDTVIIIGNRAGLISLAKYLLILAQDEAMPGDHLHLDAWQSGDLGELDEGSASLIVSLK